LTCPSCGSKDALIAAQDRQIDRLTRARDTFALAAAKARVRELEEALQRVNTSVPSRAAVELARNLAQIDPRTNDDRMECFLCCSRDGDHRRDCMWVSAAAITKASDKRRTA
jgi:hypothetical protein